MLFRYCCHQYARGRSVAVDFAQPRQRPRLLLFLVRHENAKLLLHHHQTSMDPPTLPDELWHAIFLAERQRWRRLRMCMVCNAWLRAIHDDPQTWRALVLTHDRRAVLDLPADEFVRQMVHDGALPILATHVRRLVPDLSWVTTVVLEGSTLPELPVQPGVSGILERRYFEVAWPVLNVLCGLSFPSLRNLAVDLHALTCHSCDTAALNVVLQWLQDGLPAGLELLKVVEEGLVDVYLGQRINQQGEQVTWETLLDRCVHLKVLQYVEYAPMPHACFNPDGMLQTLEVLDWSDFFSTGDEYELKQLASLEKLRMLKIKMSTSPTAEDLATFCEAVPASVEVLYLSWDNSEPFWLDEWSVFGALQGLVELCICLDSCDFAEGGGPATITSHLVELLPKATILVTEVIGVMAGREPGPNEILCPPGIIDRELLPLRVPDWHRLPGVYQPPIES